MAKDSSGTSVVVVGVGASRGTGAAIARRFAREGLHAFVAGRTLERLEIVAKEIREAGGQATPVVTDATREDDVIHLLDLAIEQGGPLDAVVYNAGRNEFRGLLDMDGAFFEEVWRLCCFTGFTVGREAARRMLERGSGSILFTGDGLDARASPLYRLRLREGRTARGRSRHGARVRPEGDSRRPRRDRRHDRRRHGQ